MTSEKMNVVLCGVLLFFMCFISLLSNMPIVLFSEVKMCFPFLDVISGYSKTSFDPEKQLCIDLEWWLKQFTNRVNPVILFVVYVFIKPPFPKWINVMWFYFLVLILADWGLFYERWPWRYISDGLLCVTQVIWTGYYLYKNR